MKTTMKIILASALAFSMNAANSLPSAPAGKKWEAVPALTDEFNSFDSSKWNKTHSYWSGRAPSVYNTSNSWVQNGELKLRMSVRNSNQQGNWINAGVVQSKTKAFKKGMYSEARVKVANLSAVTAFWMQGTEVEIDVIENYGTVKNDRWRYLDYTMMSNTHYFPGGFDKNNFITPKHYTNPGNARNADSYIVYGTWWKDARTIVYYRQMPGGSMQEVGSASPTGDFNNDMFMFFDMEPFTWGPGLPTVNDLNNNNINTSSFSWVRTYKLVNGDSGTGGGGGTGTYPCQNNDNNSAQCKNDTGNSGAWCNVWDNGTPKNICYCGGSGACTGNTGGGDTGGGNQNPDGTYSCQNNDNNSAQCKQDAGNQGAWCNVWDNGTPKNICYCGGSGACK